MEIIFKKSNLIIYPPFAMLIHPTNTCPPSLIALVSRFTQLLTASRSSINSRRILDTLRSPAASVIIYRTLILVTEQTALVFPSPRAETQ